MEDMLLHHRAYLRRRDQLNDPSELRPKFVVQGSDEQLRDYVRKIRQADPRRLSPARRLLDEKRLINRIRSSPRMPEAAGQKRADRSLGVDEHGIVAHVQDVRVPTRLDSVPMVAVA
jgi:hypothetical protein